MMSRIDFIKELESLLLDIPSDEREEALQYYNNYFDDAGEENEQEIIKELGSPERVAAIIKAELDGSYSKPEDRGYFTEKGYQDTILIDEKYEIVNSSGQKEAEDDLIESNLLTEQKEDKNEQFHSQQSKGYYYQQSDNQNQGSNDQQSGNQQSSNQYSGSQTYGEYHQQKRYKSNTKIGLIILLCILAIPVGIPVLATVFGIAVAVLGTMLALFVGFGVAGLAMMGVGTALIIAGIIKLGVPFIGFLLCGVGLLSLGAGMLFVMLTIFIGKTLFPAIIRGIVKVCKLPFENRSVMA